MNWYIHTGNIQQVVAADNAMEAIRKAADKAEAQREDDDEPVMASVIAIVIRTPDDDVHYASCELAFGMEPGAFRQYRPPK